jgi:hypothetical protein
MLFYLRMSSTNNWNLIKIVTAVFRKPTTILRLGAHVKGCICPHSTDTDLWRINSYMPKTNKIRPATEAHRQNSRIHVFLFKECWKCVNASKWGDRFIFHDQQPTRLHGVTSKKILIFRALILNQSPMGRLEENLSITSWHSSNQQRHLRRSVPHKVSEILTRMSPNTFPSSALM